MKQITSSAHPLVRYWLKLKEKSAFRYAEKRVLLEGRNCIKDVCSKIPAKRLLVREEMTTFDEFPSEEVIGISEQLFKKISSVEESDGLIAEFAMPVMQPLGTSKIIACDRIQDPGNLGTLFRSCLAFGWEGLFLLPGCVDPFNDKALRAAKGATFFLPLMAGSWQELVQHAQANQMKMLLANTRGQNPQDFLKEEKKILILGNEAQGAKLPQNIECQHVTLFMPGPMESLNVAVAGSILMYLL